MSALAPTLQSARTGGKDDWRTPENLLQRVRGFAPVGLDPASAPDNPTGARLWFTPEVDGLSRSWCGHGVVYLNPPYSGLKEKKWSQKAVAEAGRGAEILMLTPARPGAGWYRSLQEHARATIELQRRLRFVGALSSAPFPSALSYFGERLHRFVETFGDLGRVIVHLGHCSVSLAEQSVQLALDLGADKATAAEAAERQKLDGRWIRHSRK
jgi:phage N-6-adenine-methyltransferase